jgi:translation initiation factor 1
MIVRLSRRVVMAGGSDRRGGLVYSSAHGRMCPSCGKPAAHCACRKRSDAPAKSDGVVRVGRETKGRKGKGVTIVTGVPLSGDALDELGSQLKRLCGSGGTVRDGVIEIQGDHRDALVAELAKRGWTVKRSGG